EALTHVLVSFDTENIFSRAPGARSPHFGGHSISTVHQGLLEALCELGTFSFHDASVVYLSDTRKNKYTYRKTTRSRYNHNRRVCVEVFTVSTGKPAGYLT
ncbi:unnamed protein product, partial [Ectocarpus fasciculatus]